MSKYQRYEHHGAQMVVRKDLKGKHREYCLCYDCRYFNSVDRGGSCPTANLLYTVCVTQQLVTPVWECIKFMPVDPDVVIEG